MAKPKPLRLFIGTSGYGYREWLGKFYPDKLPSKQMLSYYCEHFPTVEINSSVRELPTDNAIAEWCSQTPAGFRFVLKAPQSITHRKRLKQVDAEVADLLRAAALLGKKQGPLLFQLPPNFKKDLPRLDALLSFVEGKAKAAVEFRHASWFDNETYACLKKHKAALCAADAPELPPAVIRKTTNWGYLRLRSERYTAASLKKWLARIREAEWSEAYVFFKHEETGSGPKFASQLLKLAE
jgi:uncharacterized protein YecE (DUF72 family)